ncbi:HAUS augmin-like complex subunit 4 [Ammospiza caudacuta]|uniref:HAUS augmin-like complex subunit 4 n=1 Tax=Ammospiza caudacuta TaxID=2857398 RepID=UPI0027388A06|nr:HAUS augmin-like complex subunit 4 [Ammospiza caudacuta]
MPQKPPKNRPENPPRNRQNFARNPQNSLENPENLLENAENAEISPKIAQNLGDLGASLRRERLRERRLRAELEKAEAEYPQVLQRCLSRLSQLRLQVALQARLDGGRGRYLLAKGEALLLKCRLEELQILLDTYPAPTVEAHRRIRAELTEARSAAEAEAAKLGAELAAVRELGPEFRALALELGRIRQELDQKRRVLRQLRPPSP